MYDYILSFRCLQVSHRKQCHQPKIKGTLPALKIRRCPNKSRLPQASNQYFPFWGYLHSPAHAHLCHHKPSCQLLHRLEALPRVQAQVGEELALQL